MFHSSVCLPGERLCSSSRIKEFQNRASTLIWCWSILKGTLQRKASVFIMFRLKAQYHFYLHFTQNPWCTIYIKAATVSQCTCFMSEEHICHNVFHALGVLSFLSPLHFMETSGDKNVCVYIYAQIIQTNIKTTLKHPCCLPFHINVLKVFTHRSWCPKTRFVFYNLIYTYDWQIFHHC